MAKASIYRPSRRAYNSMAQSASSRATVVVDVTADDIKAAVGDTTVVDITLTASLADPTLLTASRPFHVGTESVFVNGLRCCDDDYSVITNASGEGTGVVVAEAEAGDDVHLTADAVE